ncbi:hypothetical protein EVAR_28346_1 [Eumeta japonica]|uniref:Uncharacterized protein n=1 Tax=Eumeta variegata TaxID=151549 RepID=A0A4C1VA36_EUMVA|nr:hypothetical protein EVAR_28346_1 [Eumeta japonica]
MRSGSFEICSHYFGMPAINIALESSAPKRFTQEQLKIDTLNKRGQRTNGGKLTTASLDIFQHGCLFSVKRVPIAPAAWRFVSLPNASTPAPTPDGRRRAANNEPFTSELNMLIGSSFRYIVRCPTHHIIISKRYYCIGDNKQCTMPESRSKSFVRKQERAHLRRGVKKQNTRLEKLRADNSSIVLLGLE